VRLRPGVAAVDKRITCRAYTRQEGEDAPEITEWRWPY
jgi:phosphoketolase